MKVFYEKIFPTLCIFCHNPGENLCSICKKLLLPENLERKCFQCFFDNISCCCLKNDNEYFFSYLFSRNIGKKISLYLKQKFCPYNYKTFLLEISLFRIEMPFNAVVLPKTFLKSKEILSRKNILCFPNIFSFFLKRNEVYGLVIFKEKKNKYTTCIQIYFLKRIFRKQKIDFVFLYK